MLNNFDFVRSGAHTSAGGRGSTGTLPFMALNALSGMSLRWKTPRRCIIVTTPSCLRGLLSAFTQGMRKAKTSAGLLGYPLQRWCGDWELPVEHAEYILYTTMVL